jgi:Effector Associated Constant Component 1
VREDVALRVRVGHASAEELRALCAWLLGEEEFRGRVRLIERAPGQDQLGPTVDAVQILVGPAGTAVAAALVTWLRQRRTSVKATITSGDGRSITVEANRVRLMDAAELTDLTERLERLTEPDRSVLSTDNPDS